MEDEPSAEQDLWLEVDLRGDVATVSVKGELDAATAPELAELCATVRAKGARELVIDLTEIEFLDSSGLRALVEAHRLFANGGRLLLSHASEPVIRLLEITGLDHYFCLEDAPPG